MSRVSTPRLYENEAALCAQFIGDLDDIWTAYPETAGWDILLARRSDGFQIGIQAKLRLNLDVVNQAIEDEYSTYNIEGPDCRAVLVPRYAGGEALGRIAAYIGLTIITTSPPEPGVWRPKFSPALPESRLGRSGDWYEWGPLRRHKLPEYVPDVAAGATAPTQLTEWKIAAIKIAVILDQRGFVTRADFRALNIDHRRWHGNGWLRPEDGVWRAGDLPNFRQQHPVVYEQIAAESAAWIPPAPMFGRQGSML